MRARRSPTQEVELSEEEMTMGHFRFHRSFGNKLVWFNISKTGTSLTTGVPGTHLNTPLIGRRRRRSMITLGLPGTGLSYRQPLGGGSRKQQQPQSIESSNLVVIGFVTMVILRFFFCHG